MVRLVVGRLQQFGKARRLLQHSEAVHHALHLIFFPLHMPNSVESRLNLVRDSRILVSDWTANDPPLNPNLNRVHEIRIRIETLLTQPPADGYEPFLVVNGAQTFGNHSAQERVQVRARHAPKLDAARNHICQIRVAFA